MFQTGPEVIELFSCSTQLGMKFQLLIKGKMLKNKDFFLALKSSDAVLALLKNCWHFNIYELDKFLAKLS